MTHFDRVSATFVHLSSLNSADEPFVRLRDVVCVFGAYPALAGADLDVGPGEILHLQGANGAGKTTLLRVVAGFLAPVRGTAVVLGHDLMTSAGRRGARQDVTFVAGEPLAYEDLTIEENLRFLSGNNGAFSVADSLDRFALGPLGNQRVRQCSTGQRKRVGLAAGFSRPSTLLLLDEPHAGLDAAGRMLLDTAVIEWVREGRSVLIVSHELGPAESLATRAVDVRGGVIV